MKKLLIAAAILCIASWYVLGFSFWTISFVISTVMFCARIIGYKCKSGTVIALECFGAFITIILRLLFHKLVLMECLITLLLRVIFILFVLYDNHCYVYVQEKRRRT